MSSLAPFLVIGIVTGSIYALAAMGLVLTFRTSGIFNFAYGAQAAVGAFVMYEFRQVDGLPWPVAALFSLLLTGVIAGLLLERLGELLQSASTASRVTATVGILVATQGLITVAFGSAALQMEYFLPTKTVRILDVNVLGEQIIVAVLVLAAAIATYWFLNRSRAGAATQAVVDNPTLLALLGTSPIRSRRTTWILGSCFASVSGMLLAPTTGLDAGILTELVFFAFGAAAIGGFQSLPLTYAGGLAIGIGSSVLTKYITTTNAISALPATLPFVVLFVALLVIPKGRLIERGAEVIRPLTQLPRLSRKTTLTVATATITFLVVLPTWIQSYRLPNFTTALGYVILFMSLSLLVRTSGQISLCQITFAAVGTTTFAHAMAAGVPWLPAVLLGGLVAVPVGAVVAIPAIRLSGVYLAVATFGFALVVQSFVFPSFLMFPFSSKLLLAPRPHIFGLHTGTDTGYYYVVLIFAGLTCLGVIVILRSRLGRLLRGLADQPIAVDAHGANTNVTRVIVFCISAFMAGIGGAVIAPVTGSVTSDPFNYQVSLLLVAVLFVAGRRPIAGAFIAGALYIVVPSYITSQTATEWVPVAFGVGALVAACFGGGTSFITVMKQLHVPDRARHRAGRSKVQQRLIVSTEV